MEKTPRTTTTASMDEALSLLLQAWVSHDDLRRDGAPLADLAASRFAMESTRLAARREVREFCPAA